MSEQPAPADTDRQQLEPAAADAVRAYAAKTRENADQLAADLCQWVLIDCQRRAIN